MYYKNQNIPEEATIDEWGLASVPGSMYHFRRGFHPLQGEEDVKVIENYPLSDLTADYRIKDLPQKIQAVKDSGRAAVGSMGSMVFEMAWAIRSMEDLFSDFVLNPPAASALLDRLVDLNAALASIFAEAGSDIIILGDDIATQQTLMMSPDTWRHWLKPGLAKLIESAKTANPDVLVFYHSDGNCQAIIPDLIDIGLDILNPVQPECMDPAFIKREYGKYLAFYGTIGTQKLLPFGTPEEVRVAVKERIETVGAGGGLLLSPTHLLEPEVPWENIKALYDAIDEFGNYS